MARTFQAKVTEAPSATKDSRMELGGVPMKFAKACDVKMNENHQVHFLQIVKMTIRIVVTADDPDMLKELEQTESCMDQKQLDTMRRLENKQLKKHGDDGPQLDLAQQVAATKIQQLFKRRKEAIEIREEQ